MFVVRVRLKRDGVLARVCVVRWEFVFEVEDEVVGLCGGERGGRLRLSEVEQRVVGSRGDSLGDEAKEDEGRASKDEDGVCASNVDEGPASCDGGCVSALCSRVSATNCSRDEGSA